MSNMPEERFGSKLVALCDEIDPRFKEFAVVFKMKNVENLIVNYRCLINKELTLRFGMVYRELTQYTNDELDEMRLLRNDTWADWCNDVLIFYALRVILLNKPFPVMNFYCVKCKKRDVKLFKCSVCGIARYCSKSCQQEHWEYHKKECCKENI